MGQLPFKTFLIMCFWMCWLVEIDARDLDDKIDQEWMDAPENLAAISEDGVDSVLEKSMLDKEGTTLRCHRRMYKKKIEQEDSDGRKCWDTLSLEACWGRCDSHEVSEWKFPYKRSKHPVCGFGARKSITVRLQHCEEGAGPEARIFNHVRPVTCRCRACSSSDTSCGWLTNAVPLLVQ